MIDSVASAHPVLWRNCGDSAAGRQEPLYLISIEPNAKRPLQDDAPSPDLDRAHGERPNRPEDHVKVAWTTRNVPPRYGAWTFRDHIPIHNLPATFRLLPHLRTATPASQDPVRQSGACGLLA